MKNKILLIAIAMIMVMGLASALDIASLPTYRSGNCIPLIQYCGNCTYVNITSITYPNGTTSPLNYITIEISKGTYINNSFCDTEQKGSYIYGTIGNPDGILTQQSVQIEVNAQGKTYSTTDGIVYIGIILILLTIFIFGLYSSVYIPFTNPRNELNEIINIDYKKHIKLFAVVMTLLTFVALTYFSWNLSYGILEFPELAQFFYVLFRISFFIMIGAVPVIFVIGLVKVLKDNKLKTMLERGLTIK